MKHIAYILGIGLMVLGLAACEKETDPTPGDTPGTVDPTPGDPEDPEEPTASYAIVLNEGNFGSNNASLSLLNLTEGSIDNDWFGRANRRELGDNGQDMIAYGSKVYVTVTESNSLEVLTPSTGTSRRVDMGSRKPRHIAADGGKLYITCYDKTLVRVDTATLAVEATLPLGNFKPEGIAIAQGKAFVASGWDNSSYDNTLYVVDLASFSSASTIQLGSNLKYVYRIDEGHVLVTWIGNYGDVQAGSAIIDAATGAVTPTARPVSKLSVHEGKAYGYVTEYDQYYNETASFVVITPDGTVQDFPFTPSFSDNVYGIDVDPATGDIFIMTADYRSNGDIHCFSPDGTLRYKKEAGMNPSRMLFL